MKKKFSMPRERAAVGIAVMALMVSVGVSWSMRAMVRRVKSIPVALRLSKAEYRPLDTPAAIGHADSWVPPSAQSAGSEWIYEVFTPPVVFYDRQAASFSVTPAGASRGDEREFPFRLVKIERELFRVQLSGYAGTPGTYTAIFTRPGKPGALLVREGERLKEAGLILRHFAIKKRTNGKAAGGAGFEIVAQAELQDERSGAITLLDSQSKKYDDAPVATVHLSGPPDGLRQVREGEVIANDGGTYRISHIRSDPAEIIVTREQSGLPSESKRLRPVDSKPSPPVNISATPAKSPFRPATGIADNIK